MCTCGIEIYCASLFTSIQRYVDKYVSEYLAASAAEAVCCSRPVSNHRWEPINIKLMLMCHVCFWSFGANSSLHPSSYKNYCERTELPGSKYAGTEAGRHEIHILSLMQNSSHSEEEKGR